MKKRLLASLVAFCILLSLIPGTAVAADVTSTGSCGDNLTYTLHNDGLLTIAGTGDMWNWTNAGDAPWGTDVTSVEIAENVTSIGDWAFLNCKSLQSASIPNSVSSIGRAAFYSCIRLTDLEIPDSVTNIEQSAFAFCSSLTDMEIPGSVKTINVSVFNGCSGLRSVSIPRGITSIGDFAFASCRSLTEVSIPDTVTAIGTSVFSNCSMLTDVSIPDSVTDLGASVFSQCSGLASVRIPSSITTIYTSTFSGCTSLSDVYYGGTEAQWANMSIGDNNDPLNSATIHFDVLTYDYAITKYIGTLESSNPSRYVVTGLQDETWGINGSTTNFVDLYIDGQKLVLNKDYSVKNETGTVVTVYQSNFKNLSDGDLHTIAAEFRKDGQSTGDLLKRVSQNFYVGSVSPDPVGTASIVSFIPSNGSTIDHKAAYALIQFDREILEGQGGRPELDFDVGTLVVRRASDDKIVYEVKYNTEISLRGSSAPYTTIQIENMMAALDYDTAYYVTMPEGFIKLADGSVSPAVEKGTWMFVTVEPPSTYQPLLKKHGQFYFTSDIIGGNSMAYGYDYDESWFLKGSYETSSKDYQHGLTKMSIRGALAAYGADGNKSTAKNIRTLMEDLEYQRIITNYPTPDIDTIGYSIGSKSVISDEGNGFSIIMVAVRGGAYLAEWASNFNIGNSINHAGFAEAADDVLNGVKDYLDKYGEYLDTHKKIWIMGYSRGAATTNLVAKMLDDGSVDGIDAEDVYAFCFECPQNTAATDTSNEKYSNIVNIVNPIDLVPKVAMSAWGYSRYGTTYYLPYNAGIYPRAYKALEKRMEAVYDDLLDPYHTDEICADSLSPTSLGQAYKTNLLASELAFLFIDPLYYFEHHQSTMMNLASKYLGKSDNRVDNVKSFFTALGDYTEDVLSAGALLLSYGALYNFDYADAAYAHYGELCLSWLDALKGEWEYSDSESRIVFVNCPVNVEVYDRNNVLVGSIINDEILDIENSVDLLIDSNGQKVISLSTDMEYTIKLTATDGGDVTYTATEYSMETGKTEKVISYYQIDVEEGDVLIGLAENLSEVSSAAYPLYLNDSNNSLEPSINQNGDSVQAYKVTVSASGNGAITGGGNYVSGEFAKVIATANSGETFLGWYVDNALVSSDTEYRFLVNKDISITAKFTQNNTAPDVPTHPVPTYPAGGSTGGTSSPTAYSITIPTITGGSVTATPKSASKGSTVTLTATPDESYELTSLTVTDSKGNELELTDEGSGKYTFVMPNSKITVTAVFQPIRSQDESQGPQNTPWVNPFTDVSESAWYYDAVKFVCENSLMNGVGNNLFAPDANLSRAQLAQILYNKDGKPTVSSISPFTDVDVSAWYADAVIWATANNIVGGYGNGQFGPDDNITREQLATMLWRYAGEPATNVEVTFSDADQISEFAQDATRWAVENKILNGKGNNILDPKGFATRAEVAQMLKNYLG